MAHPRDDFLDGLRTISILRVLAFHTLLRAELPAALALSFFLPGMPLMFFVSGAVTAWSLGEGGGERIARYLRSRSRRLFVPYWGFAAAVVAATLLLDLCHAESWYDFRFERVWCWIVPLAGPIPSLALDKLVWHLWFLSALILLLGSAPWSLALHRRRPFAGALVFGAAGAALELALLAQPGWSVPGVLRNTLLFGVAFQLGYGHADGSFGRLRSGTLLAAALLLGIFAWALHDRVAAGRELQAVPLAHLALGLGFVALWYAFRGAATSVFAWGWVARLRAAVNPRAYTIYLWGPIANELAWRATRLFAWGGLTLYLLLSLVFLVGLVVVFGPLEAWAAGRGRLLRGPTPARGEARREAA